MQPPAPDRSAPVPMAVDRACAPELRVQTTCAPGRGAIREMRVPGPLAPAVHDPPLDQPGNRHPRDKSARTELYDAPCRAPPRHAPPFGSRTPGFLHGPP